MEFRRSAKSAAEIAALPALGTTQCMAHVRLHGPGFEAETLVYLLRRSLDLHDALFFELCGRLLIGSEGPEGRWHGGHCEGVIVNLAASFHFQRDPRLMREFRARCHGDMWKAIYDGTLFWEMRFGMALRQKAIDAAQSIVRESSEAVQERAFSSAASGAIPEVDEIADPDEARIDDDVAARLSNPIHQGVLLSAVRRLPKRQGAAVLLTWVEGRPIEGPGEDTVSSLMAITLRAVRMLLAKARKALQSDPAIRAIWFGEA